MKNGVDESLLASWSKFAKQYDPIKCASIDGTDSEPHDRAVVRAINAVYRPNRFVKGKPELTIFVSQLSHETTKETIREIFSKYGKLKRFRMVKDIVTGMPKGYAFIEYEEERAAEEAYKLANKMTVDGRQIFVDFECERLLKGWKPRRLGGGFGGRKESGQLRFGGRNRPFKKPIALEMKEAEEQRAKQRRDSRRTDKSAQFRPGSVNKTGNKTTTEKSAKPHSPKSPPPRSKNRNSRSSRSPPPRNDRKSFSSQRSFDVKSSVRESADRHRKGATSKPREAVKRRQSPHRKDYEKDPREQSKRSFDMDKRNRHEEEKPKQRKRSRSPKLSYGAIKERERRRTSPERLHRSRSRTPSRKRDYLQRTDESSGNRPQYNDRTDSAGVTQQDFRQPPPNFQSQPNFYNMDPNNYYGQFLGNNGNVYQSSQENPQLFAGRENDHMQYYYGQAASQNNSNTSDSAHQYYSNSHNLTNFQDSDRGNQYRSDRY